MSRNRSESNQFLFAQIAVAVVGLVGSLGGAWLASGAKFERELESRGQEIRALKETLLETQKKLDEQQVKINKIDGDIESAKQMVSSIAAKAGDIVMQKLKPSWPFGKSGDGSKK